MVRKKSAIRLQVFLLLFGMLINVLVVSATKSEAKTIKKIRNGGYITTFKTAKIKKGKLICKGTVENWERAVSTKEYCKKGTFKLKLAKKCEIQDGDGRTAQRLSKKEFNRLCKKHDSSHICIAFMVENNKVSLVNFW